MSDTTDVIDRLANIAPGSALDEVRRARPEARRHAQASYDALFTPVDDAAMGVRERAAVALFIAALHADAPSQALYAELLHRSGGAALAGPILAEASRAMARGPYGSYPAGPLTAEDTAGPDYRVDTAAQAVLGLRLSAALAHVHMLVFHPRDAAPWRLEALVQAHWSTPGIVTLSQLTAFLSFQIRVAAGLRAMAETA
jgi:CMD domain protein